MRSSTKHLFIPDTQVRPDTPVAHIEALGNYVAEKRPTKIIMIGDWWDMNSLSSYDKPGSKGWEIKDVERDIEAGIDAMQLFMRGFESADYSPKLVFTIGNHEYRMRRVAESPEGRKFKRYLSLDRLRLKEMGWVVHDFLKIAREDGISYCHYFLNPDSLFTNPIGGAINTKLRKLGVSFSMGHQQRYEVGAVYTAHGRRLRGMVAGAFYEHDEEYLGPQKNRQYWRGIVMKHEVRAGDYDLMEVSLNYLKREYL